MGDFAPALAGIVERFPHLRAYRAALALALSLAGEHERASAEFEQLAAHDFTDVPRDMTWFNAICTLAEACARLGDAERAALLYELILPHRTRNMQIGMITCWGSAERYLGLLAGAMGRRDEAAAHFKAALARNAASGMRNVIPFIEAELPARL
jgi:tetratricopeptide (TPR) repeat protein